MEAMNHGKGKEVMKKVVDELDSYSESHFAAEEALLVKAKYPGLDQQRAEHQEFTKKVEQFKKEVEAGNLSKSLFVVNFLKEWLATHIKQTDRKYTAHMTAAGVH